MNPCPRCGENRLRTPQVMNALSRTTREPDSEPVYVCTPCGQDEAFEDWLNAETGGATPQEKWHEIQEGGLVFAGMVETMQVQHDIHITDQLEENFE